MAGRSISGWLPALGLLLLLGGCTRSSELDAATDGSSLDASLDTASMVCGCRPGPHRTNIYVLSDEGELYAFDPRAGTFTFVIGPVCAGVTTPYSMAVDPQGRAWILDVDTRRIQLFDLVSPGACTDSGFLPTNPDFRLFGMGFSSPNADADCASLYVHSYSGMGPFSEGPGVGSVGIVEGAPLAARALAPSDYDGAEVTGSGDGRLFAFGGVTPPKLVELDRTTGAPIEVLPLTGLARTSASAFAFFGGDFYLFTEALPPGCDACLTTECSAAVAACRSVPACQAELSCAIERGSITDTCGGGTGMEVLDCLGRCSSSCLTRPAARVSQVTRLDWDRSDGPDRTLEVLDLVVPIRIVGAGTSPCVPTTPF